MTDRVVMIGSPRAGKTTLARSRAARGGVRVMHTDDLIGSMDWSAVSEHVATQWFAEPGPWIVEGVAAVRALRKWLSYHSTGRPCEVVVVLDTPHVELSPGQARMATACRTIWREIRAPLEARGVRVETP